MKKLVFSAIALLAFTATSFAARGKKATVKKAVVTTKVKKMVVSELCDSVYDSWNEAGCTRTNTGSGNLYYAVIAT